MGCVAAISFFRCALFVPYVNVFCHILHAFFPRFIFAFRTLYICVILLCSFSVSLWSVILAVHLVSRLVYRLFIFSFFVFLLCSVNYFVVIHFVFNFMNLLLTEKVK